MLFLGRKQKNQTSVQSVRGVQETVDKVESLKTFLDSKLKVMGVTFLFDVDWLRYEDLTKM